MRQRRRYQSRKPGGVRRILAVCGLVSLAWPILAQNRPPAFVPDISKVWDDSAMSEVELPLASRIPVRHMPSEYYYSIPVRPNLKTYPIYLPGKEPAGYWEWLLRQEPEPAFDDASLHTKEDWIRAGEIMFETPRSFTTFDNPFTDVRNPEWYRFTGIQGDKMVLFRSTATSYAREGRLR